MKSLTSHLPKSSAFLIGVLCLAGLIGVAASAAENTEGVEGQRVDCSETMLASHQLVDAALDANMLLAVHTRLEAGDIAGAKRLTAEILDTTVVELEQLVMADVSAADRESAHRVIERVRAYQRQQGGRDNE